MMTFDPLSHLESAEYSRHPPLQEVPSLVSILDHKSERTGSIGAVLPSQAAVLFVEQLQLSEPLLNLPLERLPGENVISTQPKRLASRVQLNCELMNN